LIRLHNRVTAVWFQQAAPTTETIPTGVQPIVALLAAGCIRVAVATVGVELASRTAAAALLVLVALAVVALLARLNDTIATTWRELAAGATTAHVVANRGVAPVVALFGPIDHASAAEWSPFALSRAPP
jgi:hypothetical protein